jgi:hypothetical protein
MGERQLHRLVAALFPDQSVLNPLGLTEYGALPTFGATKE